MAMGVQSYGLDMSHMSEDLRIAKAEKMAAMKEERASKPRAKTPPKVVAAPRQPHRPGRLTEEEKVSAAGRRGVVRCTAAMLL